MTRSRLTYLLLVIALIGGAIALRYQDPFFVRALRLIAFDHFQRLDPPKYDPDLPVRIVDIDEASLAKIGQWPWPRTTVRDLLAGLAAKGAAYVIRKGEKEPVEPGEDEHVRTPGDDLRQVQ